VGLLTLACLARLLSTSDYGSYRQVFLVFGTLAPMLSLALPQALYYFLPRAPEESRSILSANLFSLLAMGGVFTLILWGGSGLIAARFHNPGLERLLLFFAPYTLFALPLIALNPCLVSLNRVQLLVPFNLLSRLLMLAGAVLPVLWLATTEAAVIGVVGATAIASVAAVFLMYWVCREGPALPRWSQASAQLRYSLPLGAAAILGMLSVNLDKLLVSAMFSPGELAVYANGAMELPVIGVITGSVTAVLLPEFAGLFQRGAHQEALQLWHRAMLKCALILLPIMVFCFVMAPEIIRLLFSAKYGASVIPFRIYLLNMPLRIASYAIIPQAAGRNRVVLIVEAISGITQIVLGILLMRGLGPNGVAIAYVLNFYGAIWFGYLPWIRRYLGVSWAQIAPWRQLIKVSLACLVPVILLAPAPFLPEGNLFRLLILFPLYAAGVACLFHRWALVDLKAQGLGIWRAFTPVV
jgi:O-antigen/teichoic acid export membrane protein